MILEKNFTKKFEGNFSEGVNLSNYSWFNLGGDAEFFFKANNKSQLLDFLTEIKKKNLKLQLLALVQIL